MLIDKLPDTCFFILILKPSMLLYMVKSFIFLVDILLLRGLVITQLSLFSIAVNQSDTPPDQVRTEI